MIDKGQLRGVHTLVPILTRPAGQSLGLRNALTQHGIVSLDFPLIDIQPVTDYGDLDAALATLERDAGAYALVFFVSPNAIDQVFARAKDRGVDLSACLAANRVQTIIAVVGPGSVRALAAHGITPVTHHIVAPAGALDEIDRQDAHSLHATLSGAHAIRYDSEALWQALLDRVGAQVTSQWFSGRTGLILRGDGGREWLADALRGAGMTVQAVATYTRALPKADADTWAHIEGLVNRQQALWVLSSSEGVRNLETLGCERYGSDPRNAALKRCAVIVPHHRIADAASRAGFDTITNCGGGDANLLRVIRDVLTESERIANENGKPYA